MAGAGVPCVPGYHGDDQAEHRLQVAWARGRVCMCACPQSQLHRLPRRCACADRSSSLASDGTRAALCAPQEEAGRVGFPLLVKAVMGGGGKGMKLARGPGEFLVSERAHACMHQWSGCMGLAGLGVLGWGQGLASGPAELRVTCMG